MLISFCLCSCVLWFSCEESNQQPPNSTHTSTYTSDSIIYHVFYTIDTITCNSFVSSYSVGVFKINNQIIDTLDLVNPPIIIGENKCIYVKIKAEELPDSFINNASELFGHPASMNIYDNGKITEIKPEGFNAYFSSWVISKQQLYYTTFANKGNDIYKYLRKYNLYNQSLVKMLEYENGVYGTDVRCPDGYIYIHGDSVEIKNQWVGQIGTSIVIDTNLNKIIGRYTYK